MYFTMAACLFSGVILAKLFKCFVLIPASVLVVGLDLFVPHDRARGFSGIALEIILLVTSLQVGYLASVLSPFFRSVLAGQKIHAPDIFGGAPFARVLSGQGRMLRSTRNAIASEPADVRKKDKPAA